MLAAEPAVLFLNLYLGLVCEYRAVFPLFLLSLTKFSRFSILSMVRTIPSRLHRHLPLQSWPQRTSLHRIRSNRHIHIRILLPIPPIPPRTAIHQRRLTRSRGRARGERVYPDLAVHVWMVGTRICPLDRPYCRCSAITLWDILDFSKYFDVSVYFVFEVYRVGVSE